MSVNNVHSAKRRQRCANFLPNLVAAAEDVHVVLLEAADAREARECTTQFVAVQRAKVQIAHWKVAIGADALAVPVQCLLVAS